MVLETFVFYLFFQLFSQKILVLHCTINSVFIPIPKKVTTPMQNHYFCKKQLTKEQMENQRNPKKQLNKNQSKRYQHHIAMECSVLLIFLSSFNCFFFVFGFHFVFNVVAKILVLHCVFILFYTNTKKGNDSNVKAIFLQKQKMQTKSKKKKQRLANRKQNNYREGMQCFDEIFVFPFFFCFFVVHELFVFNCVCKSYLFDIGVVALFRYWYTKH